LARLAIIFASLLAAFQAGLWGVQRYWLGMAVAAALALALGGAARWPRSSYARVLSRPRVLHRSADESERAYWFRVALAWLLAAVVCLVGGFGAPLVHVGNQELAFLLPLTLLALCPVLVLMALQSLLYCLFCSSNDAPPDTSLERTREI
jgi:hypothetical protein